MNHTPMPETVPWSDECLQLCGPDEDRLVWLALRRTGIGASETAAVMGKSKWATPLKVWADKCSDAPVTDEPPSEEAFWGQQLEAAIGKVYSQRNGLPVQRVGLLRSKDREWELATPDLLITDRPELIEVKTAGRHTSWMWDGGQTPQMYVWQVQKQMLVTGFEAVHLTCLIEGQRTQNRYIERDEDMIGEIREVEERFWRDHVLAGVPPTASADDSEVLSGMFPEGKPGVAVELPLEAFYLRQEYLDAHERMKTEKEVKARAANGLKAILGDREVGILDGKPLVTWKTGEVHELDVKALKADHPDLVEKYMKCTTQRRIHVAE